jgi:hypothetical protein
MRRRRKRRSATGNRGASLVDEVFDAGSDDPLALPARARQEVRVSSGDRFIGCPRWWFKAALVATKGAGAGGFAVAIYLWHLRVKCHSKTIKVTNVELREFEIDRRTKYLALRRLAAAKLIRVKSRGKFALEVSFLR